MLGTKARRRDWENLKTFARGASSRLREFVVQNPFWRPGISWPSLSIRRLVRETLHAFSEADARLVTREGTGTIEGRLRGFLREVPRMKSHAAATSADPQGINCRGTASTLGALRVKRHKLHTDHHSPGIKRRVPSTKRRTSGAAHRISAMKRHTVGSVRWSREYDAPTQSYGASCAEHDVSSPEYDSFDPGIPLHGREGTAADAPGSERGPSSMALRSGSTTLRP